MNKVILMGRLTRDPEVKVSSGENQMTVARYTLAVDRPVRSGDQQVDFIRCVTFGKTAEFAEKYLHQGTKIAVIGRIQTGSYTDKDGKNVYTTDVVVENHEFAESKGAASKQPSPQEATQAPAQNAQAPTQATQPQTDPIPDGFEVDAELPFNF